MTQGTFGPMASAFSVCALVENWKVVVPEGGEEAYGIDQEDPKWYSCPEFASIFQAEILFSEQWDGFAHDRNSRNSSWWVDHLGLC